MHITDAFGNEVFKNLDPNLNFKLPEAETILRPERARSIELITGASVIELLLKQDFQESMDRLFAGCTWATVFQSRSYITAWYQTYRYKHLPILAMAVENGKLIGIVPLALLDSQTSHQPTKRNRITGAGHYDAGYQTWLALPGYGESFIKEILEELMKKFPGHPVTFRFLPPGTPLNWLKNDKKWRRYAVLQSYIRPLINFNKPEHARLLQSKHFKSKLKRLKKLGEVHLETVCDPEIFKHSLDELAILHDFRFSALFNKHHFRDDPAKKELLLELFRLKLLHVTILKVNSKTFAAVVGIAEKGWVHLSGFSCHSPFNAQIYSPGLLHFSLLSKALKEEERNYFDLTPGYDPYKEKLATEHDEVHELMINSSINYRFKKRLRKWIHIRLLAKGIRPMTAELAIRKYFYQLRHISVTAALKKMAKILQKKKALKCYTVPERSLKQGPEIELHKDNLNDLLRFRTDKKSGITRWKFLADAMYRFETGQHCYTWVENDRLSGCAWVTYKDAALAGADDNTLTQNITELRDPYCYNKSKEQVQVFLNNIINTVIRERHCDYFLTNDKLICQVLEARGFYTGPKKECL